MNLNTVWRFVVPIGVDEPVEMPVGANILRMATKDGEVCVWAVVDPQARKTRRFFTVRVTGSLFEEKMRGTYIGSARADGYELHLFETTFVKGLHEEASGR